MHSILMSHWLEQLMLIGAFLAVCALPMGLFIWFLIRRWNQFSEHVGNAVEASGDD